MLLKQTNISLKNVMTVKIDFNNQNFDQLNHITCDFHSFKKNCLYEKIS